MQCVLEGILEVIAYLVQRQEHEAYQSRAKWRKPSQVLDKPYRQHQAVNLYEESWIEVELLRHGGIFNSLGAALRVHETCQCLVDGLPLPLVEPAALACSDQHRAHSALQRQRQILLPGHVRGILFQDQMRHGSDRVESSQLLAQRMDIRYLIEYDSPLHLRNLGLLGCRRRCIRRYSC